MEQDKVCDAIHQLELNLSGRIHKQTTTMEVMNERLDNLRSAVDRHRVLLYGPEDGHGVGLVAEMDQLKTTEQERKWTMRTVTASFFALLGNFLWNLWHG